MLSEAIVIAVAAGWLGRGKISSLARLDLKQIWLVFLAFSIELGMKWLWRQGYQWVLPWRLQLVEKLAYKRVDESYDVLPGETLDTVINTLLWINRINFHLTGRLDAGVEYRFLKMLLDEQGGQLRHGALVELGYWLHRYVRLGAGYNFSSFTDNEFVDQDRDASGFFFRVVGRY